MPSSRIQSGLPALPNALPDKEAGLVKPIYVSLKNITEKISEATGQTDLSQDELANLAQTSTLLTQNHTRLFAKAVGSTLAFGKIVNLYLSGGKIAAQYADATDNTKPAHGIVNEPLGIPDGTFGEILLFTGHTIGIGGTALGTIYYLSTNGAVQAARPAAVGSIIQACGVGLGTAGFYLNISSLFIQN